jgi:LAO/AO transport system kinase
MYESINESLKNMFYENPVIEKLLPEYEYSVLEGELESFTAASELIEKYKRTK